MSVHKTWPDAKTSLFGIIGHPTVHSLSPAMHNAAFRALGLNAVYLAFDVTDLDAALAGIRGLDIKGVSVTIPHKEAVLRFLDEIDPVAHRIGAVNTIVNRSGRLFGMNTDYIGALSAIEEVIPVRGRKVLVLGAGGAARAVCAGLADRGAAVHVANRTPERAKALAEAFDLTWSGFERLKDIEADILINTTSIGMYPDYNETPIEKGLLMSFEVVMDIVYSPLKTRLLKEAGDAGCKTINGLKMLLYQAEAQFELWTGQKAPRDAMKEALNTALDP
ncbi:MAG: shikimate dehydrogenase [Dissulfurimicrobium sp.]|uniref:shikimate dehydrogenase n=1 Tax=Dissulfurimicrobium sp. TaxID=2022436 RepID=UPI0040495623